MYNEQTQLRKKADVLTWNIAIQKMGLDCEICGNPMDDVHHIFPKGQYPYLRYDFDNLTNICRKCHEMPDREILDELEKKRGKMWRKRLEKKAKNLSHIRINVSWYEYNIKRLEYMGRCLNM